MQNLINTNIPEGSTVTSATTTEINGSTFLDVRYTITDQYQQYHALHSKNRILRIRVINGPNDYGLPITSFADPN